MSSIQLAMELAAPEHPGRWLGAMIARLVLVGGLIWLVVWAVRRSRTPQAPQYPYPPAYYQQYPPPQGSWPQQTPPPGQPWPPQAAPPYPPPGWPQQPPPYPPHGGPPPGTR